MKNTSDAGANAAEFLKLWQEEITRQMHDPDMIRAMLAAMQPFGPTGAQRHDETSRQPSTAPDALASTVAQLERRVAALEHALAGLSQPADAVAAKAQKPAGASKRRRAKPMATLKRRVVKKSQPSRKK